ncbi:MAG: hypothetical protein ACLQOO_25940 [Terriglobia bacterium]
MTVDAVMEQFDVTREQVHAVLGFVARSLGKTPVLTSSECWFSSTTTHREGRRPCLPAIW